MWEELHFFLDSVFRWWWHWKRWHDQYWVAAAVVAAVIIMRAALPMPRGITSSALQVRMKHFVIRLEALVRPNASTHCSCHCPILVSALVWCGCMWTSLIWSECPVGCKHIESCDMYNICIDVCIADDFAICVESCKRRHTSLMARSCMAQASCFPALVRRD